MAAAKTDDEREKKLAAEQRALEEKALREQGVLGRAGPYGNGIYAMTYERLPMEARQVLESGVAQGMPVLHPQHDSNFYATFRQSASSMLMTGFR